MHSTRTTIAVAVTAAVLAAGAAAGAVVGLRGGGSTVTTTTSGNAAVPAANVTMPLTVGQIARRYGASVVEIVANEAAGQESDSGGSDGIGFAIPSNTVRSAVAQLIASGKVEHRSSACSRRRRTGAACGSNRCSRAAPRTRPASRPAT